MDTCERGCTHKTWDPADSPGYQKALYGALRRPYYAASAAAEKAAAKLAVARVQYAASLAAYKVFEEQYLAAAEAADGE